MTQQATIEARAKRENAADLWRPIPGYEGWYDVSRQGEVRSLRNTRGNMRASPRPVGSMQRSKADYPRVKVALVRRGSRKDFLVHRLVLLAFVGPCPEGMEACHNNGDPADNRLENLRWDTPRANSADAQRHGTQQRGVRNGRALLNPESVRIIRALAKEGQGFAAIGRRFGVGRSCIRKVVRRITWGHVR